MKITRIMKGCSILSLRLLELLKRTWWKKMRLGLQIWPLTRKLILQLQQLFLNLSKIMRNLRSNMSNLTFHSKSSSIIYDYLFIHSYIMFMYISWSTLAPKQALKFFMTFRLNCSLVHSFFIFQWLLNFCKNM